MVSARRTGVCLVSTIKTNSRRARTLCRNNMLQEHTLPSITYASGCSMRTLNNNNNNNHFFVGLWFTNDFHWNSSTRNIYEISTVKRISRSFRIKKVRTLTFAACKRPNEIGDTKSTRELYFIKTSNLCSFVCESECVRAVVGCSGRSVLKTIRGYDSCACISWHMEFV